MPSIHPSNNTKNQHLETWGRSPRLHDHRGYHSATTRHWPELQLLFGIRVALGAQRSEVLQAALGRALKLLGIGSAVGLILGVLASRVLGFIVYQATPRDPLVLTGVILAMALLGLIATWVPAQRALSVDPLMLLRED